MSSRHEHVAAKFSKMRRIVVEVGMELLESLDDAACDGGVPRISRDMRPPHAGHDSLSALDEVFDTEKRPLPDRLIKNG
jgi:hypothetical protein